jgi:large repetitive protein
VWGARISSGNLSGVAALDSAAKPLTTVGAQSDLAVTDDGTILAASASAQRLVTIRPTGTGFGQAATTALHRQMPGLALTAVGDTPVILDANVGAVLLPGGNAASLPGGATGSGPAAARTRRGCSVRREFFIIDPSSPQRQLRSHAVQPCCGHTARPVVLGDCVHAAWGGAPGIYARACDGKPASAQKVPSKVKLSQPVFRVNRGQIRPSRRS